MGNKFNFGLIGKTLKHSFSKQYFEEKLVNRDFDGYGLLPAQIGKLKYELYELPSIIGVQALLDDIDMVGFNITIPYKQAIFPYLTEIDTAANSIGAVNVVALGKGKEGTKIVGYNTDYIGFMDSLISWMPENTNFSNYKALVLGSGGASKAIVYALNQLGISWQLVSRQAKKSQEKITSISYDELENNPQLVEKHKLIINTSPVGTYPHSNEAPRLPYHALTAAHYLYDLVYNPKITKFMREGQKRKAKVTNGYQMLVGQAEASWKIWLPYLQDILET